MIKLEQIFFLHHSYSQYWASWPLVTAEEYPVEVYTCKPGINYNNTDWLVDFTAVIKGYFYLQYWNNGKKAQFWLKSRVMTEVVSVLILFPVGVGMLHDAA